MGPSYNETHFYLYNGLDSVSQTAVTDDGRWVHWWVCIKKKAQFCGLAMNNFKWFIYY